MVIQSGRAIEPRRRRAGMKIAEVERKLVVEIASRSTWVKRSKVKSMPQQGMENKWIDRTKKDQIRGWIASKYRGLGNADCYPERDDARR